MSALFQVYMHGRPLSNVSYSAVPSASERSFTYSGRGYGRDAFTSKSCRTSGANASSPGAIAPSPTYCCSSRGSSVIRAEFFLTRVLLLFILHIRKESHGTVVMGHVHEPQGNRRTVTQNAKVRPIRAKYLLAQVLDLFDPSPRERSHEKAVVGQVREPRGYHPRTRG